MTSVVCDAGALIAADRNDRNDRLFWADHRARLELGIIPLVPAPVLAQVSRSPKQTQLRRLLRGCQVVPLDESAAHHAGALLGKARARDVADAAVVSVASAAAADIVSSDCEDIERLVRAARIKVRIIDV